MVRVWYEPPPGGPRSHLNRGGYYFENSKTPEFVKKLARMKPTQAIIPAVAFISLMCYVPISKCLTLHEQSVNHHHLVVTDRMLLMIYSNLQ